MKNLKFILNPKSSIVSDFHSDTIFGHICWAIKYVEGENKLREFLKKYQAQPPLILSSGFPRIEMNGQVTEFLPKPILKPLRLDEEENLFNNFYKNTKKEKLAFSFALKSLKKQIYISTDALNEVKEGLSYEKLYELVFRGKLCPQNFIPKPSECSQNHYECPLLNPEGNIKCPKKILISKTEEVYHNTKNRLADRVKKEGGLFSTKNIFFNVNSEFLTKIVIYIKSSFSEQNIILNSFEFISKSGFGADKSIGKGQFEFDFEEDFNLPEATIPNAFMVLSNYYPQEGDPVEGHYETIVKIGKLGGDWAKYKEKNWPKDKITYFKMPINFIAPGAVFKTANIKSYYGRLIPNVHIDNRIVQYGYAMPLGMRVT